MRDRDRHARDLFDRARAVDQNAIRELVRVREDAARGDPASREVYGFLVQYGRDHPEHPVVETAVRAHGEGQRDRREEIHALGILRAADQNDPRAIMWALHRLPAYGSPGAVRAACVALSHQRPWTDPRIAAMESLLPDEPRRAVFREAVRVSPDARAIDSIRAQIPIEVHGEAVGTLCAGYCLGAARKFQIARVPGSPVSVVGADVGWECGL